MLRQFIFLTLFSCIQYAADAQSTVDTVVSGLYTFKEPAIQPGKNNHTVLFEGKTRDFDWMQLSVAGLSAEDMTVIGKARDDEERLLIIKSGSAKITLADSSYEIRTCSVCLFKAGDIYSISNIDTLPLIYYLVKYRSKKVDIVSEAKNNFHSFIIDYTAIPCKTHDRGGIRNYFDTETLMAKRIEMHLSTLNAGIKSHEPHTHRAAEIVIMINGNTSMQIGDKFYSGQAGDLYFLAANILHAIMNTGEEPCSYFAFQFE